MSISYSGITNYGKVSLPAVSGGFGTLNIIKDPPRSIHTRRKDRVGQNMDLVQTIQDSGNRSSEVIRQFALGVNPMVSVSYSNNGNNGGQGLVRLTNSSMYNKNAYNPNSLGAAGFQFRPPVRKPQELLPLSRQPRTNTYFSTNPEMIDYTKKLACPTANDLTKEILQNTLKINVRPNEVYKIEKPIEEPFEVKYVIQNPTRITTNAGMRTRDIKDRGDIGKPSKVIYDDPLSVFAHSNMYDNRTYITDFDVATDKYIQNAITNNVQSSKTRRIDRPGVDKDIDVNIHIKDKISNNIATNKGIRIDQLAGEYEDIDVGLHIKDKISNNVVTNKGLRIDQLAGEYEDINVGLHIKDNMHHIDYTVPIIGTKEQEYIHNDPELRRSLPMTSANSNITKNVHKVSTQHKDIKLESKMPSTSAQSNAHFGNYVNESSRDYYLPSTSKKGGFDNSGFIPSNNRMSEPVIGDDHFISERTKLLKRAASQFEGRYSVSLPVN